jgi:ABC-type transport system involved in cytochrome c biogenesis permease subunit
MTELSHEIAALLYLLAALLGWRAVATGAPVRSVLWFLGAGVLVHAAGVVVLHREDPPIPLASFPAALSLIGWLIAVSYLLSLRFARIRGISGWVSLAAAFFTVIAWGGLFVGSNKGSGASSGAWSHAHVLLSAASFSFLALASVAGVAYLAKKRALEHKSGERFGLPSLESLDRMEHFTLAVGFPLLTLVVATGFVWSIDEALPLWSPHTLWMLVAWVLYLTPMLLRVVRLRRGAGPARSVVLAFLVLAFSYIGVRLLGGGV